MLWDAVLPILTLILGYVGSLYTESRREARDHYREARRQVAEIERQALIELQDILNRLPNREISHITPINDALERGLTIDEVWATQSGREEPFLGNRAWTLISRISDDELRGRVRSLLGTIIENPFELSERVNRREQTPIRWAARWTASTDALHAIGEHLRSVPPAATRRRPPMSKAHTEPAVRPPDPSGPN